MVSAAQKIAAYNIERKYASYKKKGFESSNPLATATKKVCKEENQEDNR